MRDIIKLMFIDELRWRGFKQCTHCNTIRPLHNFSNDPSKKRKVHSHCKECRKTIEQARRKTEEYQVRIKKYKADPQNRLREKNNNLRRLFNLTLDQYNVMIEKQNGKCAICKIKSATDSRNNSLSVDHDHTTNKIRGLLCTNCNLGLGNFHDNIDFLGNAITYLEKHK